MSLGDEAWERADREDTEGGEDARELDDKDVCPHGLGFDEICEDCDEEEDEL